MRDQPACMLLIGWWGDNRVVLYLGVNINSFLGPAGLGAMCWLSTGSQLPPPGICLFLKFIFIYLFLAALGLLCYLMVELSLVLVSRHYSS